MNTQLGARLLTLALLLVAGCDSSTGSHATPRLAQTAAATPHAAAASPATTPALPQLPSCRSRDLTARWGSSDGLTAGQIVQSLLFTNAGPRACALLAPLTKLTGSLGGRRVGIPLVSVRSQQPTSAALLAPGASASSFLYVQEGCDRVSFPSMPPKRTFRSLRVVILGGALAVADGSLPHGELSGCFDSLGYSGAGTYP